MKEVEKTNVENVDRSIYDIKDKLDPSYIVESGLTEDIILEISKEKNDPDWMRDFRLKSLEIYNKLSLPDWGAPLDGLNMDDIITYIRPNTNMKENWNEVPQDIRNTFERLGIPEAEKTSLAGVGAQYDSEIVYHRVKQEVEELGVVYTDMESALNGEYADLVKKYFMSIITPNDHKFAALHGAVWSGGSFVYIPKGVKLDTPLQSYFRLNAAGAGQFEHTLIIVEEDAYLHFIEGCSAPKYNVNNLHAGAVELVVKDNSRLRYSTIENWSKNMYNLNSKRAIIGKDSTMEWVSGSFGSHTSYLYPMTLLNGEGSKMDYTGITFASSEQNLDTGVKVVHNAKNTSSHIFAKSISREGGISTFRSEVTVNKKATNSMSTTSCESLMLDSISKSDTVPVITVKNDEVSIGHEAKIGQISDDIIFYLLSRGIKLEDAKALVVSGFAEPIAKQLPVEYAVEMNNLIQLELEGTIG